MSLSQTQWDKINSVLERTAHLAFPLEELEAELRDASEAGTILHARRMEQLGVSRSTIADLRRNGWGWGVVNAVEHPSEPGLYCLDPDGAPHLVLPVYDRGELIDLVAFRSSSPGSWLLRRGHGWALGLERGLEAHTWEPVLLTATPLDWLRCGARGLCVLDWSALEVRDLRDVPHIVCQSSELASLLEGALSQPLRLPAITVEEAHRAAA